MTPSLEPALKIADTISKFIPRQEISPKDMNDLMDSLLEEVDRTEPRRVRVEMLTRLMWKVSLPPDLTHKVFALTQEPDESIEDVIRWLRISRKRWSWKDGQLKLNRSPQVLRVQYWALVTAGTAISGFGAIFYFKLQQWVTALRATDHPLHWSSILTLFLLSIILIGAGMVPFAWAGNISIAKKLEKLLNSSESAHTAIDPTQTLEASE